jgi:hypothetical protein
MSKEFLGQTTVNSFPFRHDGEILTNPKRSTYDTLYENKKPSWWRRIFGLGWKYEKEADFRIRKSYQATLKADEIMGDRMFKTRLDEDGRPLPKPTAEQIGNNN